MKQEQVTILIIIFLVPHNTRLTNLRIESVYLHFYFSETQKHCEIRTNNTNGMTQESNILVPPNYHPSNTGV